MNPKLLDGAVQSKLKSTIMLDFQKERCPMKNLLTVIAVSFLPVTALANAESDKNELKEVGQRIVNSTKSGKTDWSCIGKSGRDFCKIGADHFSLDKNEVKVSGLELSAYLESLKALDAKENACLDPVFKSGQFTSKNWKEYETAAKCVRAIDHGAIKKPNSINYFYFNPGEIFSQNGVDEAVKLLEAKRNEFNASPAGKVEAESEVVTQKEFEVHQKKIQKQKPVKQDYPEILSAEDFISNGKKYLKRIFRIGIQGRNIVGIRPNRGTFEQSDMLATCQFNYLNVEEDAESVMGDGHYLFDANFYGCKITEDMEGHPTRTGSLLVRFEGTASMVNKLGQKLILPLFKVVAFNHESKWLDTRGGPFNPKGQIKK